MRLSLGWRPWPAVQGVVRGRAGAAAAAAAAATGGGSLAAQIPLWRCARPLLGCALVPVRGKRTRTVVRVNDLPQGVLLQPAKAPKARKKKGGKGGEKEEEGEEEEEEEDSSRGDQSNTAPETPAYPYVVLQARRNMQRFANCVLLTRVGGFYELYFEQAQEYGPQLNIKVATKRTAAGPVPMAGFPFFQLDRFLKILVHELHQHVAIAEEFPNVTAADKLRGGGLMHDRRVARIVTPGTLIDETFMDPYTNNYVLGIHVPPPSDDDDHEKLGLAWLDLSTGHFYTQETTLAGLGAALSRVAPREIVLDERLQGEQQQQDNTGGGGGGGTSDQTGGATTSAPPHRLFAILEEDRQLQPQQQPLVTFTAPPAPPANNEADLAAAVAAWAPVLESPLPADTAQALTAAEVGAGCLVLHYVGDRLQGSASLMKLQPPVRYGGAAPAMALDKNTLRALEVKTTLRDGAFRGSLLHAVRRTVTRSGARLLNEWLGAPSTSLSELTARQDRVARFVAAPDLRDALTQLLRRSHDAHRLVQKFALGRGGPDDLLDLAKTIDASEAIADLLIQNDDGDAADAALLALAARIDLDRPRAVAEQIRASVDEEGLQQQHEAEEAEALLAMEEVGEGEKAKAKATTNTPTANSNRRRNPSIRDYYGEDNEAWVMKPSASPTLTTLHAQLAELVVERGALTETLRTRLQAPSLMLKWTPGLGHICHVKGRDAKKAGRRRRATAVTKDDGESSSSNDNDNDSNDTSDPDDEPTTLSSSRTTRSLHVPEWTALGQRIDQVRLQIRGEELRVFQALRAAVVRSLVPLRRNAAVLDELDIATAFARLASERGWCRPQLHNGTSSVVIGGRHPTVEGGLAAQGRSFTANDLSLGVEGKNTPPLAWLITGPNMAGKSTFLRQTALITLLAQVGSYVPAAAASLGLADALFARVGSADNLFRDQSTFMVEMLETAHILKTATARSVVIMDEIGRGTTPEDGAAVAYAALHHLVHRNQCRTLFATHFHVLADRVDRAKVGLYCTDVAEDATGFAYVHRLRAGVNRQSHALKVARLAGLPEAAIAVAEEVLAEGGKPG